VGRLNEEAGRCELNEERASLKGPVPDSVPPMLVAVGRDHRDADFDSGCLLASMQPALAVGSRRWRTPPVLPP
jgi:hypothetical protein